MQELTVHVLPLVWLLRCKILMYKFEQHLKLVVYVLLSVGHPYLLPEPVLAFDFDTGTLSDGEFTPGIINGFPVTAEINTLSTAVSVPGNCGIFLFLTFETVLNICNKC